MSACQPIAATNKRVVPDRSSSRQPKRITTVNLRVNITQDRAGELAESIKAGGVDGDNGAAAAAGEQSSMTTGPESAAQILDDPVLGASLENIYEIGRQLMGDHAQHMHEYACKQAEVSTARWLEARRISSAAP
jgi:hypothetical protein